MYILLTIYICTTVPGLLLALRPVNWGTRGIENTIAVAVLFVPVLNIALVIAYVHNALNEYEEN